MGKMLPLQSGQKVDNAIPKAIKTIDGKNVQKFSANAYTKIPLPHTINPHPVIFFLPILSESVPVG